MPTEYENLVNRLLRDHIGYTGDGQGNEGDLPIGDMTTARKPIEKRDLRQLFLSVEGGGGAGDTSAVRFYDTREGLAADLAGLAQGATVLVAGQPYVVDSTATGVDSALQDLGVNGVRRPDRLENLFVAVHFTTQDDVTIKLSVSLDGVNFTSLNAAKLPGGGGYLLDGRDPSICWYAGYWWVFVTGNAAGSHDFAVFKSRDLTSWSKFQVAMQGGPYASATVPMPGGVSPASAIWAPEPFIENGRMYVMISIRYGADFTNIYGATQQHFRPYITECTNPETLAFSTPQAMNFGPGDHTDGNSRIDPSVIRHGAFYYCAIKDSYYRRIQIYRATSIAGPWEYRRVLTGGSMEIEAPCLVRVRDRSAINTEARREKFRVYVDNNRTGAGDPNPNGLVGAPYYFETTGAPDSAYGPMTPMYFDGPVRHGSIVNVAEIPPEATERLIRLAAVSGGGRKNLSVEIPLSSGTAWIRPQQDMTYVANATTGSTNLIIRDGPADRFYLAAYTGQPTIGINVLSEAFSARGFLVGFGRGNDQVIEMRRRGNSGGYFPVGLARRDVVRANKGGADQVIAAGSEGRLTFDTEIINPVGSWAPANRRWTPPRGSVNMRVKATVAGVDAGQNTYLVIRKNGVIVAQTFLAGGTPQVSGLVVLEEDYATGSDYYEVFLLGNGTTAKTVRGSTSATELFGECW